MVSCLPRQLCPFDLLWQVQAFKKIYGLLKQGLRRCALVLREIQMQQCTEGLILRGSRHLINDGQMGEEGLDFWHAHIFGMFRQPGRQLTGQGTITAAFQVANDLGRQLLSQIAAHGVAIECRGRVIADGFNSADRSK